MITLVATVTPEPAHAYQFNSYGPPIGGNGQVCPNGNGLTRRIVPCIRETIITAVNQFMGPFSAFMARTINALCVLAIALGGIWVTTGRVNAGLRDMSILFMKIGFVSVMTNNFGGMFSAFLDMMEDMLAMAGQYAISMSSLSSSPNCPQFTTNVMSLKIWEQVDCAIENLLGGIYMGSSVGMGLAGFLMAAFLSTTAGIFVALLGFYIIFQFLYAIAKATYTFISAYLAFSFMVLISPLFIPCILLRSTKPYFDKWLRLTVSFMLQPMIVFAYISMLIVAFDQTVFVGSNAPGVPNNSVYYVLTKERSQQPGFTIGPALRGMGIYAESPIGGQAVGVNPRQILEKFGGPNPANSGVSSIIGNMKNLGISNAAQDSQNQWSTGIYNYMGLGDNGQGVRFFKVDWPTTAVDWKELGARNGFNDVTEYMIYVFTSFFMAAVVAYIFLNMLDSLPFLSAGLAGVPAGMPVLGAGPLSPPGTNLMDTFKSKMEGLAKPGGGK